MIECAICSDVAGDVCEIIILCIGITGFVDMCINVAEKAAIYELNIGC